MVSSSVGEQKELKEMESVYFTNSELSDIRSKHPATFPVDLAEKYIRSITDKDDIVIDPFLGSGSTLIACEKTNRICYGMELDPKYVDVIIKRWEDYTGNKAIKL
jgi:DNA modification methylase